MLTYLSVTVAQMISNHTNLNEANFAADKKKPDHPVSDFSVYFDGICHYY